MNIPKINLIKSAGAMTTIAALWLAACQNSNSPTPTSSNQQSVANEVGVTVPTQDEADAAAEKEITKENADKAFEDLQKEIEGGG